MLSLGIDPKYPCSITVIDGHRSLASVIGYHFGFGDKDACPSECFNTIKPKDFDIVRFVKALHVNRSKKNGRSAKVKKEILEEIIKIGIP